MNREGRRMLPNITVICGTNVLLSGISFVDFIQLSNQTVQYFKDHAECRIIQYPRSLENVDRLHPGP